MASRAKKTDTLSSSIYEEMRQDILVGRLKAGEKLTMAAAQLRYSAGISPIREALSRLVPEDIVEKEEQKGFWIQSLTEADLEVATQMRCWLEDIANQEHLDIIETAIDRGADTASRLLQEHCGLTAEHIMKSLSDP
jgi:DNA-binding GntR family transcriptional regulator